MRSQWGGWHRRLAAVVGIGSFFDIYEVFLGGVLAAVLAEHWHLDTTGKSLVISSAFIGMFIGANVMSVLADRFGRRTIFIANLLSYSVLSIAAAFSPDVAWLVVLRLLAGVGIGSELVLVDTYLAEFLPARARGRYISAAYVIGFLGVPVAALLGARVVAAHQFLGLDGWRWLLIAGGLGAFFVLLARSSLPESPRWLELHGRQREADAVVDDVVRRLGAVPLARTDGDGRGGEPAAAESPAAESPAVPLSAMFAPPWRRRTVMLWIFHVLQTFAYYGFGSLAPLVLLSKGYSVTASLGYAALSYAGYPVGAILATFVVERFERKFLIIGSALLIAVFGLVFGVSTTIPVIVSAGFLLTVASNVFSNAYHVYQTELYPTSVRSSAIGIAYSLSRAVSAILPFVAVALLDRVHAAGIFTASAVLIVLLCLDVALLGPRTNGRPLDDAST
jgi:putative MFS transporter